VLSVDWIILILQLLENITLRIILRFLLVNIIYMHKEGNNRGGVNKVFKFTFNRIRG